MTDTPEKMPLTSMDVAEKKRAALERLFPGVVAEGVVEQLFFMANSR